MCGVGQSTAEQASGSTKERVRCLELSRTGASVSEPNQRCLLSCTRLIPLASPLLFTALQPRAVSPRELARLPHARVYLHTQQTMLRP